LTFLINSVQDERSPATPLRSPRMKSRLGLGLQLLLGICTISRAGPSSLYVKN